MVYLENLLLFAGLFIALKVVQLLFSFIYSTWKSITIHKSLSHAFHPPLSYRLKYGLMGDVIYFIAGILIALFSSQVWSMLS